MVSSNRSTSAAHSAIFLEVSVLIASLAVPLGKDLPWPSGKPLLITTLQPSQNSQRHQKFPFFNWPSRNDA